MRTAPSSPQGLQARPACQQMEGRRQRRNPADAMARRCVAWPKQSGRMGSEGKGAQPAGRRGPECPGWLRADPSWSVCFAHTPAGRPVRSGQATRQRGHRWVAVKRQVREPTSQVLRAKRSGAWRRRRRRRQMPCQLPCHAEPCWPARRRPLRSTLGPAHLPHVPHEHRCRRRAAVGAMHA